VGFVLSSSQQTASLCIPLSANPCMCERHISVEQGKDAVSFLEKLVVGDIRSIENGSGSLSVFTNEKGGIIDDTVVTKVHPWNKVHFSAR